jgi:HTH-type transcriptional regulator/antitoxin HipB
MKITSTQDLAAAVRGQRQNLGLTQAELATRAGVSRPWLSEVETGKPTAEFGKVIRLVDALGLTLELVASGPGVDDAPAQSVDLDAILDEYRNR